MIKWMTRVLRSESCIGYYYLKGETTAKTETRGVTHVSYQCKEPCPHTPVGRSESGHAVCAFHLKEGHTAALVAEVNVAMRDGRLTVKRYAK